MRFRLPPRRYFPVIVFGAVLVAILVEHSRPSRSELPVFEPVEPVFLEPITVAVGEHRLSGRVLAPDGSPAASVLVELAQDGEPHWAYTDDEGEFAIAGLDQGEVEVALVVPGHPPVTRTVQVPGAGLALRLPAPYSPIDPLPDVERAALYGSVASPLGTSVEGYEVVFEPLDAAPLAGPALRRVRVFGGGRFTITDLVVGRYQVYVVPEWARGGSWPRLSAAEYEHMPSAPDLRISLDAGQIAGRLLQADGTTPLVGGLVTVRPLAEPTRVWPPARSGEDGSFEVGDLPAGTWVARLESGSARIEQQVEVLPGRRRVVDFGPVRTVAQVEPDDGSE